jgi:Ca-activated chloride channel homolog
LPPGKSPRPGADLDPKAADWPALREQLEALLPKQDPPPQKDQSKPDEKKPEQNKDEKSDSKDQKSGAKGDSQKSEDQKKQDQSKSDSGKPDDQKSSGGDNKSFDPSQKNADSDKKSDQSGQSAFGDMQKDKPESPEKKEGKPVGQTEAEQPAPDPSEMQQVGGTPTEASTDPARQDPSLTIPLQKLDQVKQGDSPARLFQLLQEPGTGQPAPKGKDW